MYIGEVIKDYRIKHNLSQRAFALKANLSASYINTLEKVYNAKSLKPYAITTDVALQIANAMNVSVEYLLSLLKKEQNISLNTNLKDKITSTVNMIEESDFSNVRMIPLYSKITNNSNWKNRYLSGYIPIKINTLNVSNSGFYFYYKLEKNQDVKFIGNEIYLLIREQNYAHNNNIILGLLNKKLLIRRYQKLTNNIVLLENNFNTSSGKTISLDLTKDDFIIIGRVIGYLGNIK